MGGIYEEENHAYKIDLRKSINSWQLATIYKDAKLELSDVDFICETEDKLLFVEYKNAKVFQQFKAAQKFKPESDSNIHKVSKKFFDSYFFVASHDIKKPIRYVYVLEWPNDDEFLRGLVRNNISRKLPFLFQRIENLRLVIESFEVLSIKEWNDRYPELPFISNDVSMEG